MAVVGLIQEDAETSNKGVGGWVWWLVQSQFLFSLLNTKKTKDILFRNFRNDNTTHQQLITDGEGTEIVDYKYSGTVLNAE